MAPEVNRKYFSSDDCAPESTEIKQTIDKIVKRFEEIATAKAIAEIKAAPSLLECEAIVANAKYWCWFNNSIFERRINIQGIECAAVLHNLNACTVAANTTIETFRQTFDCVLRHDLPSHASADPEVMQAFTNFREQAFLCLKKDAEREQDLVARGKMLDDALKSPLLNKDIFASGNSSVFGDGAKSWEGEWVDKTVKTAQIKELQEQIRKQKLIEKLNSFTSQYKFAIFREAFREIHEDLLKFANDPCVMQALGNFRNAAFARLTEGNEAIDMHDLDFLTKHIMPSGLSKLSQWKYVDRTAKTTEEIEQAMRDFSPVASQEKHSDPQEQELTPFGKKQ